jgi:dihydrofolate reductase
MEGGTTFVFVTEGIGAALEQAKQAAGGRDVLLGGGASAVQQYLAAGLVDEFELHLARSCSAPARGFLRMSATSTSSRSARSRRRASPTSPTASSTATRVVQPRTARLLR